MINEISSLSSVFIKQRKELAEILGVETRNKYEILDSNGKSIGFAAEQQKDFLGMLTRQIFGHWRSFDINIYDSHRQLAFKAHHPFRFYYQRLEICDANQIQIGNMEKRFSVFSKKFEVFNEQNSLSCEMHSGFFRVWTFPFTRNGKEIAKITKKWSGLGKELFLDADNFLLEFYDRSITPKEKITLLSAAVFVDLMYFENNQGRMNLSSLFQN